MVTLSTTMMNAMMMTSVPIYLTTHAMVCDLNVVSASDAGIKPQNQLEQNCSSSHIPRVRLCIYIYVYNMCKHTYKICVCVCIYICIHMQYIYIYMFIYIYTETLGARVHGPLGDRIAGTPKL